MGQTSGKAMPLGFLLHMHYRLHLRFCFLARPMPNSFTDFHICPILHMPLVACRNLGIPIKSVLAIGINPSLTDHNTVTKTLMVEMAGIEPASKLPIHASLNSLTLCRCIYMSVFCFLSSLLIKL